MITYEELHEQNDTITELSNVLLYLFQERSMCDTGACCELFHRYTDKVSEHIDLVDKNLYTPLLNNNDPEVRKIINNFMSGSQEIKKLMVSYTKQWCPHKRPDELLIGDHEKFLEETERMFDMILQRIQDETEKLYPLIRKISGNLDTAAA
jgi:hemerythrin-like domain-containing protein